MNYFCSIDDIEKAIPEGNLNLPSDLFSIRETAQNWIVGKLSSKYKTERFDNNIPIIKQLTIDYARAYILTFNYVNTDFNEPADFFSSINKFIDDLLQDRSNIFRHHKKENQNFTNNQYIIDIEKPRGIKITDNNGTVYWEKLNYNVSYLYHTLINKNIPDNFTIEYEESLRR